jgi:AraC-like DNA-binding protein
METTRQNPQPLFLKTLNDQIEKHLSDATLDIKKVTRLVGMSRTDLHRKLDRIVGMSTTEYIRHVRLRKAADLLILEPEWSVYHICLEVGFSNQSYFTKRFKALFGKCPTTFRSEN